VRGPPVPSLTVVPSAAREAIAAGRGVVIRHELPVPRQTVWDCLVDGSRYGAWNPFILRVDGVIAPASAVLLVVQLGSSVRRTPHIVTRWEPGESFGWRQTFPPTWLLHGERWHVLADSPQGATYDDVFWFVGPLARLVAPRLLPLVERGLRESGDALSRHLTSRG
jgi:hypothetical protein